MQISHLLACWVALSTPSLLAQAPATEERFPFVIPGLAAPPAGSVVDVSWLNERPAGGHGFVRVFLTVGAPAPLQEAAVTGLELPDSYYEALQATYTEKRALFLKYLDAAGLTYTRPDGAYYVMVDITEFGWVDDVEFCEWMVRAVGVAAVPGSSFFREPVRHLIRFHFAKKPETLVAAGERLAALRERHPKRA